nr:ras-related protein Rab-17 [Aotus nancymaae]
MAQAHRSPQPSTAPSQPRVFKLVLLGSGSVGKSSLALRYVKNDFKSILPTVGFEHLLCSEVVARSVALFKLEITGPTVWMETVTLCDLESLSDFRFLDLQSLHVPEELFARPPGHAGVGGMWPAAPLSPSLCLWEETLINNAGFCGCFLQEGKEFADSQKLLFMETSAKLNHQVLEVFSAVARELLQRDNGEGQAPRGDAAVALNERPARQAKCCAQ